MRRLVGLGSVVVGVGIAAGCGGGGGGGSAAPAKVTVVHPAPLDPTEKMAVVLDDSAGRLVSSITVTGAGSEEVTVPNHGSVLLVTALNSTNIGWAMVAEPAAGTTITIPDLLTLPAPAATPAPFQTWNVTWNGVPGATTYQLSGPCNASTFSGTSGSISNASCPEQTTAKLLTIAFDNSQTPLAWHQTAQLPALPNTTTPVTFSLDQSAKKYVSSVLQNPPAGLSQAAMQVLLDDPDMPGATVLSNSGSVPPGAVDAFSGGWSIDIPEPVIVFEGGGFSAGSEAIRLRHLPAVPGSLAFDMTGLEVPPPPGFDGVSGEWLITTPAGFGDGVILLTALREGNSFVAFEAILPPGSGAMPLPQVPPEFLPATPLTGFAGAGAVLAEELPTLNGYADFVDGEPFARIPFGNTVPFDATLLIGVNF